MKLQVGSILLIRDWKEELVATIEVNGLDSDGVLGFDVTISRFVCFVRKNIGTQQKDHQHYLHP